jgi:ParB family transcriptional regulator, chromosome partitioning protein
MRRCGTMRRKVHELKTAPSSFRPVVEGYKTFEFRRDDRGFDVGDILRLREWTPAGSYTGRSIDVEVTYILCGPAFGVPRGYVVMAIEVVSELVVADPAAPVEIAP